MTPLPSPVNQVYNIAVGERTTLNELFAQIKTNLLPRYPHLQGAAPAGLRAHPAHRAGTGIGDAVVHRP